MPSLLNCVTREHISSPFLNASGTCLLSFAPNKLFSLFHKHIYDVQLKHLDKSVLEMPALLLAVINEHTIYCLWSLRASC
jgi:hypothetical protein